MYEENRRISWTNLFIKGIIVIIFILFTVWLLSLSTKDMSNSLSVLTDQIFSENMEKMKEVGTSYFTTERLPENVGDIKSLTLAKMYDKNLILELKDKNGNTCSANNSYVSIEKMDNEYQMKVYLECGNEKHYTITIMGCYSYCETDICEVKKDSNLEYEYKKANGGYWTSWGNWSDWSKTSVSETNYRDVETKVVKEDYSYDKNVTEKNYKREATCASVSGYSLVSNKNGVCTYERTDETVKDVVCPNVSGYDKTGQNGYTCIYTKKEVVEVIYPTCPELRGFTATKNGNTCNYTMTSNGNSTDPVCPSVSGYTLSNRNGFTCTYSKQVTSSNYTLTYYKSGSGSYVPKDTDTYHYEQTSAEYKYVCNNSCAFEWYYTYKIYKKNYSSTTETTSRTASCPSGYNQSDNTCTNVISVTTTKSPECPYGYETDRNLCIKYYEDSVTRTGYCQTGYYLYKNNCYKDTTSKITRNATCPSGESMENGKCYEVITKKVNVTEKRDVTYYRYRLREYIGGDVDYQWSSSDNDKNLLNKGYTLTGKTREKEEETKNNYKGGK